MANYSTLSTSALNTLFSGISMNKSGAATSSLYSSLSEYTNIKSGTYRKVLNAYYNESDKNSKTSNTLSKLANTSTSNDTSKSLSAIKETAEGLKESSDVLFESGKDTLFNQKTTTDKDGNKTTRYDTDSILKAVKDFVSDYNDMVEEADNVNSTSILRTINSVVSCTKANNKLLKDIGITIKADNKLSINEEAFKKADMSTVKSMFQGYGSYGFTVSSAASKIDYAAQLEIAKANTYNQYGNYSYNYTSGSMFDSLF